MQWWVHLIAVARVHVIHDVLHIDKKRLHVRVHKSQVIYGQAASVVTATTAFQVQQQKRDDYDYEYEYY